MIQKKFMTVKVKDLIPYDNNPRVNDKAVSATKESMIQCENIDPIEVDENMVILSGHTRRLALMELGYKETEVIVVSGLSDEQKRKYRILANKTNEFAEWDIDKLSEELADLDLGDFDWGFDIEDVADPIRDSRKEGKGSLLDRFLVPPFSVFDTKQGYWRTRKNQWIEFGIRSSDGRGDNLTFSQNIAENYNRKPLSGTSIFDPVLCEICYKWFNVEGGKIYDCFAGGSVRGIVAESLGYDYTGIDLRQEQIDSNYENADECGVHPNWICDDSLNADLYVEDNSVDMIFSCPPYADLEVYSDDE